MKTLVIKIYQPPGTPHVTLAINQDTRGQATPREHQYAIEIQKMLTVEIPKLAKQIGAVDTIVGTNRNNGGN